eukprot:1159696-Pelagomonas_calceolata.AAC.7
MVHCLTRLAKDDDDKMNRPWVAPSRAMDHEGMNELMLIRHSFVHYSSPPFQLGLRAGND